MAKTRKPYFDLMRLVAILFVIWNHTGKYGFALYTITEPGSVKYWLYGMASVFCTFAVPLFFMISGALVLPKATTRDVWLRRIPKQVLILVFFSLAYYILAAQQGDITKYATLKGLTGAMSDIPAGTSIPETEAILDLPGAGLFLTVLYSGAWNFALWFLYAYIAFLISAPLLRVLAEHMSNMQYLYLFGAALVFKAGVPLLNWTVFRGAYPLNNNFSLGWMAADILLYPLAGYFLERRFPVKTLKSNRWFLPALWGVTLLCLFIAVAATLHKSLITDQWTESTTQTFHRVFCLLPAAAVYLTVKDFFYDKEGKLKEGTELGRMILTSAGTCTFGIYLLHVAVLKSDWLTLKLPVLMDAAPRCVTGFLQVLITFAICWGITALWKGGVSLVQNLRTRE